MPSTPTQRLRLERQELGSNLNTWGSERLNEALERIDESVAGVAAITISGPETTLSSANYAADQSRRAVLVLTGTLTAPSNVNIPNVEKQYSVVNNTTGAFPLVVKTAAGSGYTLRPGPQVLYCDGVDVHRGNPRLDQVPAPTQPVAMNGQRIIGLATPTLPTDAATKAYADTITATAQASAAAAAASAAEAAATAAASGNSTAADVEAAAASQSAAAASAAMAANAAVRGALWGGVAGGTATALTLSPDLPVTNYLSGLTIRFLSAALSTGPATISVNGLAAKPVKSASGLPSAGGEIQAGVLYQAVYDGTAFRLSGGGGGVGSDLFLYSNFT